MANPANVANLANANCCAFARHYTTGSVLNVFDTPYIVRPVREAPRDKYLSNGLCLFKGYLFSSSDHIDTVIS